MTVPNLCSFWYSHLLKELQIQLGRQNINSRNFKCGVIDKEALIHWTCAITWQESGLVNIYRVFITC